MKWNIDFGCDTAKFFLVNSILKLYSSSCYKFRYLVKKENNVNYLLSQQQENKRVSLLHMSNFSIINTSLQLLAISVLFPCACVCCVCSRVCVFCVCVCVYVCVCVCVCVCTLWCSKSQQQPSLLYHLTFLPKRITRSGDATKREDN